ncbi:MAG: hypothetical protein ABIJ84_00260 [bacterium]
MDKKIIIITAIVIVLLVVLLGGYFLWLGIKKPKPGGLDNLGTAEDITNSATKGVLPSLQTNPLEDKPDINPADKANPFTVIKTNPF